MLQIYPCAMIEYAPGVPMQPITKHRCVSVATERRSVCGHTDGDTVPVDSDSCVRCFCGCRSV